MAKSRKKPANPTTIRVASDITLNKAQHQKLIEHFESRLQFGDSFRQNQIKRYEIIDRELNGFLRLSAEDRKRQTDNNEGLGTKPVEAKLSLIAAQIDEAVTYLLSVLAPDESMYTAMAPEEQQEIANGLAAAMNEHGEMFAHFREYAMFLLNALKYNEAYFMPQWEDVTGNRISNAEGGLEAKVEFGVLFGGNSIKALDAYNTLYDPTVTLPDLYRKGEWFATVENFSDFRLKKMLQDGEIHNMGDVPNFGAAGTSYYQSRPEISTEEMGGQSRTNWLEVLSAGDVHANSIGGNEIVNMRISIVPKEFGLSESTKYEIWHFVLKNSGQILAANHQRNAHGFLPFCATRPLEDQFGQQTKSFSELLMPLQRFASHQMNVHVGANRKSLFGVTFYNKTLMPDFDNASGDMTSARIPVETNGQDVDLRKHILHINDSPDTSRTMQDIEAVHGLMQQILPTDTLRQVAGLERATQYQAAATVQSANRRNLKIARIINTQAMTPGRHIQYYNIMERQDQIDVLGPEGKMIIVNPTALRESDLQFTIADGLKGLDRLALIINIKEVLNSILQSSYAANRIDIVKVINYWTSLLGDHTDFAQFALQSPIDTLPVEQRNIAFELLQQAIAAQEGGEGAQQQAPVQ